jgi:hypothetical protein
LQKKEYLAKLKSIGEQNKEKILEHIAKSEPEGRSTSELKEETGLHRDTIYNLSKQLESDEWIRKSGKYGKYRLTEKALNDPSIGSWIFRGEVMRGISKWSVPTDKPNKFCRLDVKNLNRESQTERELFDFANKIGALITYIMLHALRPRDITINGSSKMKVKLSGKEKSEQAIRWVENTISPFWILDSFQKLRTVKEGLAMCGESSPPEFQRLMEKQNKRRKMQPHDPLWTQYELDEDTFSKLATAFANTYPEINAQLEYIRKTLPDKIQKHKEWDRKYLGQQKVSYT